MSVAQRRMSAKQASNERCNGAMEALRKARKVSVLRISVTRKCIHREVSQVAPVCKESLPKFDNERIPQEVSQIAPVLLKSLSKFDKVRLVAILRISVTRKRIPREVSQVAPVCKESLLKFCNGRIPREVSQIAPV